MTTPQSLTTLLHSLPSILYIIVNMLTHTSFTQSATALRQGTFTHQYQHSSRFAKHPVLAYARAVSYNCRTDFGYTDSTRGVRFYIAQRQWSVRRLDPSDSNAAYPTLRYNLSAIYGYLRMATVRYTNTSYQCHHTTVIGKYAITRNRFYPSTDTGRLTHIVVALRVGRTDSQR